jgi:hypothetical protein
MAELTPGQQRARERMEGLIAAAAPALDLVLALGDRISRIVGPEDHEYLPARAVPEPARLEAPRGSDGGTGEGAE